MEKNKIEYNKRMIGKFVWVIETNNRYKAKVVRALDDETFIVRGMKSDSEKEVNMFDIRSV